MELQEHHKYILRKGAEKEEIVTYLRMITDTHCRVEDSNFSRFSVKVTDLYEIPLPKEKTFFGKLLQGLVAIAPQIVLALVTKKYEKK